MNQYIVGILVVCGVVSFQVVRRYVRQKRIKQWWMAAEEAVRVEDVDTAEKMVRKCVRAMPLWTPGRVTLAAVLVKRGDLAGAEQEFKLAAELEPRRAEGHLQLGLFYAVHRPDAVSAAVTSFERALECDERVRELLLKDTRLDALRKTDSFKALLA